MKEKKDDEIYEEKNINNYLNSVSIEGVEIILNQMKNSVCKIFLNDENTTGTGFFCFLSYPSNDTPFLISNEHILKEKYLKDNKIITISLENGKSIKKIDLREKRIIYINVDLDITLIEIKPNVDNIDINNCLELDKALIRDDELDIKNKSIYILQYPNKEKNLIVSNGLLSYISGDSIYYKCNTDYGSSGSPIISLGTYKVLGMQCGIDAKSKNYNIGRLFKYKLDNLNERKNSENKIEFFTKIKEKTYEYGKYIGEFKNDLREGKGIIYYNDGDRYEGEFKNDLRDGKGNYYFNDGSRYEGDWKIDLREGKGIFYYNNGNKYEGDFKNGLGEGKGIFYYNNGQRYEGEFKNSKIEGKGVFYFINGDRYEGNYKNERAEGKGIMYYSNGDRYEGDFKNGFREGKGIYYYNNGDREMGDYMNGKKIGNHVILFNNGTFSSNFY